MKRLLLALSLAGCTRSAEVNPAGQEVYSGAVETTEIQIATPRGAKLEARVSRPRKASGPLPGVVLAPGVGYDMNQPLMKGTAERLAERGFMALRFNWDFYTHKTPRVSGLVNEIEDVRGALAHLRKDESVDRERVFVVGKSLGSLAAVEAAIGDEHLAGLVIYTLAMHDAGRPQAVRPTAEKLTSLELPVLIVGGDEDPLCDTEALKELVGRCRRKPEVVIVRGNHTLQAGSPEATEQSVERAVRVTVDWLSQRAGEQH